MPLPLSARLHHLQQTPASCCTDHTEAHADYHLDGRGPRAISRRCFAVSREQPGDHLSVRKWCTALPASYKVPLPEQYSSRSAFGERVRGASFAALVTSAGSSQHSQHAYRSSSADLAHRNMSDWTQTHLSASPRHTYCTTSA